MTPKDKLKCDNDYSPATNNKSLFNEKSLFKPPGRP